MKKIRYNLLAGILIGISLSVMYSCQDDTFIAYDLELSDYQYMFPAEGGTFTVTVNTNYNEGWHVDYTKADWITESDKTNNSITFEAIANESSENAPAIAIKFISGEITKELSISQLKKGQVKNKITIINDAYQAISPDGHYIVTFKQDEYNENGTTKIKTELFIHDTETGEIEGVYTDLDQVIHSVPAISNTGIMVISTEYGASDKLLKDGKIIDVVVPAGFGTVSITDINADGTVYIGHATDTKTTIDEPFKWVEGEPVQLPRPETTRVNPDIDQVSMVMPESVSPDGKNIVGRVFVGYANEGIYWKDDQWKWMGEITQEEKDGVVYNLLCRNGPFLSTRFSNNSRYFAGRFQAVGINRFMGFPAPVDVPAIFDFETEKFIVVLNEIIDESPTGGDASHVTDDAKLFYYHDGGKFIWDNGSNQSTKSFIENHYGLEIGDNIEVMRLNEEKNIVVGTFSIVNGAGNVLFYVKPETK